MVGPNPTAHHSPAHRGEGGGREGERRRGREGEREGGGEKEGEREGGGGGREEREGGGGRGEGGETMISYHAYHIVQTYLSNHSIVSQPLTVRQHNVSSHTIYNAHQTQVIYLTEEAITS